MATVYSDRGFGVRAPVVFYNRCNEAAAQLKQGIRLEGNFRRRRALGALRRNFRRALPTTGQLAVDMMTAAKNAGAVTCSTSIFARSCGRFQAARIAQSK